MITQNDNGSEAMAIINAALEDAGIEATIGNESGASVATKLNGVFDDELITSSLSGSEFAQAVEDGFDGLEPAPPPVPHEVMRFLHISDTHGKTPGLQHCLDTVLSDSGIAQVVVSGDLCPYNSTQDSMAYYDGPSLAIVLGRNNTKGVLYGQSGEPTLTDIDGNGTSKMVYIPGNHDRFDIDYTAIHLLDENDDEIATGITSVATQIGRCRRWTKYVNGNNVTFGNSTPEDNGIYWHKDITDGTHTVRIIGIEDYGRQSGSPKMVHYTQVQVTWLLNLLYSTPSDYHIMVITHESPFKEASGHTAAVSMRPTSSAEASGDKSFVSEIHANFHERSGETNVNLLPMIMQAYLDHEDINTTWTNSTDSTTVTVSKAFSEGNQPATLIGWLCGHNHDDYTGYMPSAEYGTQLLLGIAAADSSTEYAQQDDLLYNINASTGKGTQWASTEPSYRVNELIIDFTDGTLTVKRHGNKTTANVSGRSYGGRVRDEVTFPL